MKWKNSLRNGLSNFFAKTEIPSVSGGARGVLWSLKPSTSSRLQNTIFRYFETERESVMKTMFDPGELTVFILLLKVLPGFN